MLVHLLVLKLESLLEIFAHSFQGAFSANGSKATAWIFPLCTHGCVFLLRDPSPPTKRRRRKKQRVDTLFPTIMEVHKGVPQKENSFLQSSPVNFHDCWREGKCKKRRLVSCRRSQRNAVLPIVRHTFQCDLPISNPLRSLEALPPGLQPLRRPRDGGGDFFFFFFRVPVLMALVGKMNFLKGPGS